MGAKLFGASVKRTEDPALLQGRGRFVEDIRLPGLLHAAFVRSTHAHAQIRKIDADAARRLPGVVGIFTFGELTRWLKPLPPLATPPPGLLHRLAVNVSVPPQYPLACDTVRYVGEALAVVVAESRYAAEDAVQLVAVDYEPLPVVRDARAGAVAGTGLVHAQLGTNVVVAFTGATGNASAAFAREDVVVVAERFRVHRATGMPIEPRGVAAAWEPRDDTVTTWNSTQLPHHVQQEVAAALDIPIHKVRVIAPDVGGGFGIKACSYGEDVVIPVLAKVTGRPVRWIESRREHLLAAAHSRDQVQDVEMAATADGRLVGLRGRVWLDIGAYNPGGFILAYNTLAHLPGPYRIPNIDVEFLGVLTNKTPVAPYRGAGRPEAIFALDRSLDLLARRLRMDPAELRLANMIGPEAMPYDTGLLYRDGQPLVYDSGDYPTALRQAMATADYGELRCEQARLRASGVYRGVGISAYVEGTALGPFESGSVRIDRSGRVVVATGACSQGQGHETVFAQIAADALGVPLEWVSVIGGDTDRVPFGIGTFVSRSAVMAGNAVATAAQRVREQLLSVAADLLEAKADDIEIDDGFVFVRGVPSSARPLAHLVQAALPTYASPGVGALEATTFQHVPTVTYANGAHIAYVEVDVETGGVRLLRYVVAHDCGRVINPLIVEGQIHGGVAQGVGGALAEAIRYDGDGHLLSGTLMEYALPTATWLPPIETAQLQTPSPRNALGIKGVGEGGAISPPAAIAGAIEDALSPFGIRVVTTPVTPEDIIRAGRTPWIS